MARSHWKIDGGDAREISWTLLSGRGKLAMGRREIHLPVTDSANWQTISDKPEWSWRTISFAVRGGLGGETFLHRLGFHYVDITQDGGGDTSMRYRELSVPHWFLCALLLIAPIWWVMLRRKRKGIQSPENKENHPVNHA